MKTLFVLVFAIFVAVAPASAAQNTVAIDAMPPTAAVAAFPVTDMFEDGSQSLRLIALPDRDSSSLQVTLVYQDSDEQILRSVTIDPEQVGGESASTYAQFLEQMDPNFVSFVKASLADRLLHLRKPASTLERAESVLFFPTANRSARIARGIPAESSSGE